MGIIYYIHGINMGIYYVLYTEWYLQRNLICSVNLVISLYLSVSTEKENHW